MTHFRKIECCGNHYEMGRQQGSALKESIKNTADHFLNSKDYKRAAGKFISAERLFKIIGGLSSTAARISSNKAVREWKARVEGIADGVGFERSLALGAQAVESVLSVPMGMSQCTTVGITAERSGRAGPLILKNYDIDEFLRPASFFRTSRPDGKLQSFEMFINVLAGSHIIMNEAGLCMSYNYGMVKTYPRPGILPTYIIQYAAENFTETRQVINWISGQTATNGCLITVADSKSDFCVIEKAGSHTAVRLPEEGVTVATNYYLTREMNHFNYDVKTVFGKRSPASLAGISVQESNELRYARASFLLNGKNGSKENISSADLMEIARDHNEKDRGDEKTICRHHEAMMTLASIILVPRDGKVLICNGNPCSGQFEEIDPW